MAPASSIGTMRALLLTKPTGSSTPILTLSTTQPIPEPPPGHLLVRVHASAIQPSDVYNAKGGFSHTTFPRVPGRDFSGRVVAAPSAPARVGQDVFGTSGSMHAFTTDGFQAEYAVVPEGGAAPKPAALSHTQAATVGVPFTTAALVLKRAAAVTGETVLVLGANGAVGRAVCVIAEGRGCTVLRGVRGPRGDVDTAADPKLEAVMARTAGRGVDVVIDAVGSPELTSAAVETLARGGRLAFIAAPKGGDTPAHLSFAMQDFYRQERSIVGCNSAGFPIDYMGAQLAGLQGLWESGKWKDAVDSNWQEISLEEAVAAYSSQEKGKKFVIKIA